MTLANIFHEQETASQGTTVLAGRRPLGPIDGWLGKPHSSQVWIPLYMGFVEHHQSINISTVLQCVTRCLMQKERREVVDLNLWHDRSFTPVKPSQVCMRC